MTRELKKKSSTATNVEPYGYLLMDVRKISSKQD